MIVIAAATPSSERHPNSNFGAISVDVFAPGVSIETLKVGGGKTRATGTSIATAVVSAIAGKILFKNPKLTVPELIAIIRSKVKPSVKGTDRA